MTNVSVVMVTSGTKRGTMRWDQQSILFLNCSTDSFYSGSSSQCNLSKSSSIWFVLNLEHLRYLLLCMLATQVSDFGLVMWTDGIFPFVFFIGIEVKKLLWATVETPLLISLSLHWCQVKSEPFLLFTQVKWFILWSYNILPGIVSFPDIR